MIVTKELTYCTHESGTKFYELALFGCADTKRYMVVRRWGKMANRRGGGELHYEKFGSHREAMNALSKMLNTKRGRGYSPEHSAHGLVSGTGSAEHEDMRVQVDRHYRNPIATVTIFEYLDVAGGKTELAKSVEEFCEETSVEDLFRTTEERKAAKAAIKPEPVRSDDWASW